MRMRYVVVDGKRYDVDQYTSPNLSRRNQVDRDGNVLHITAGGSYRGDIAWQMNPDQRYADGTRVNSASTWICGRNVGEIAQMGEDQWQPSSQRAGNASWNSTENVGIPPQGLTPWQIKVNAYILWWLHEHRGVPIAVADNPGQRGLGHHSMDRESWGEEWGHESCPGPAVIRSKPEIVKLAQMIKEGETVDDATINKIARRTVEILLGNGPEGDIDAAEIKSNTLGNMPFRDYVKGGEGARRAIVDNPAGTETDGVLTILRRLDPGE